MDINLTEPQSHVDEKSGVVTEKVMNEYSCQSCVVEVLQQVNEKWERTNVYVRDAGELCERSKINIIFASANTIRACHGCRQTLSKSFDIPSLFWTAYCKRANGYFGCDNIYSPTGEVQGHTTWFRFQSKQFFEYISKEGKSYKWYKTNVFTRWTAPETMVCICFDAPGSAKMKLPDLFFSSETSAHLHDPYWPHTVFAEELAQLQNDSVWSIRTLVRNIEETRPTKAQPDPDYQKSHDIARHAIHVQETLDVSVETLQQVIEAHDYFFSLPRGDPTTPSTAAVRKSDISNRLTFYLNLIQALRHRSSSNKERLQNEIHLAFNSVAQYDSRITVQIGRAAQSDNAAMKTLSTLTLTFLPATFISAIFGMSFFNYNPDGDNGGSGLDGGEWSTSPEFWRFWAAAVPVTIATAAMWFFWQRMYLPRDFG